MTENLLYDALGPRARRRALIGNLIAATGLLIVTGLVLRRLDGNGQLDGRLWRPLIDPGNEVFARVWELLGYAVGRTLLAASLAIVLSLAIGVALCVARLTAGPWWRGLLATVVQVLRGAPVVIMIYLSARVLPEYGVQLNGMWYVVIGLTAYNSVVFAEIIRSGIAALPRGQAEAAYALGLTHGQTLRKVQLPQAFRIMLPALISQIVVALKDTSLGFVIQWEETVRTANLLIQTLHNPIQMFLIVGAMFVIINYLISRLAHRVEKQLSRSRTRTVDPEPASPVLAGR